MIAKMKHLFLFLFTFGLSFNSICQVAIINDKDGFTNIRKTPSPTSEIIYKIQKHQVFLVDEEGFSYKNFISFKKAMHSSKWSEK